MTVTFSSSIALKIVICHVKVTCIYVYVIIETFSCLKKPRNNPTETYTSSPHHEHL